MKIILSDDDIVKLVYNAFVDGGLTELGYTEIELLFTENDYDKAKDKLKANPQNKNTICFEDVLIQLFKEGKLQFKDHNDNKKYKFTLAIVRKNLNQLISSDKLDMIAIEHIVESLNENGDADAFTHWNILQYMLFKELIYG